MSTIFLTGFPGFLGSRLLPSILSRSADADAVCLVQPHFVELSRQRVAELERAYPHLTGRIRLVTGDVTRPGLGLDEAEAFASDVSEIYHLAAVYDLTVPRDLAVRVNVDGTKNLLSFARICPALARFQYVSTCYVSGRYAGTFTERDLEKGQRFNNFYEETKYLAEVEVQAAMRQGLSATIYRPGIVVGDSRTGETQKYDGPYVVIRWLLRQPRIAFLPVSGDPKQYLTNVVPSDFVIDAMAHLSGLDASAGKVYQLADPDPLTVDQMIDVLAQATDRKVVRLPVPRTVAKGMIHYVPFVERILQIPAESVDYFTHPTRYTSDNTRTDLEGSGITCPRFDTYAENLVRFVRQHPEVSSRGMA